VDGASAGDEIVSGTLLCERCGDTYPIAGGIPRMAGVMSGDERHTAEHFEMEFTSFVAPRPPTPGEQAVNDFLFYSRTGFDPHVFEFLNADPYDTQRASEYVPDGEQLTGAVALDAGCGGGRFTRVAAASAEYVVGLDLGRQVDWAAAACRDLDNVDFVQGSVRKPPFMHRSFDRVFSIGVVHHTPDPAESCLRLGELVREHGALAVWVYSDAYWGSWPRSMVNRALNRRISRFGSEDAKRVAERILYPLGRLQARLARRKWLKLLAAPVFLVSIPRVARRDEMIATILDYYGPRFISTHAGPEVVRWLEASALTDVQVLPVPTSCIGWRRPAGPRAGVPIRAGRDGRAA